MNEDKIIKFMQKEFLNPDGIGDDAAIFAKDHIISKDLLVEDVHFRRSYFDSKSLAHKAIQVNLSDMAAMGAKPIYIMLGVAIPKDSDEYVNGFLSNFAKECKINNLILIGGDTTSSPDKLFISITVIGRADSPKRRNKAKVGDIICVYGNLGYAYIGLQALENKIPDLTSFKEACLRPNAVIKEGLWFAKQAAVTAMMDISDGLLVDLKKLCTASNVSSEININTLKTTQNFLDACHIVALDPLSVQLVGGEDYGLLITVKAELYEEFELGFQAKFSYPLQRIGKIITGNTGEVIFDQSVELKLKSFSHFGELN